MTYYPRCTHGILVGGGFCHGCAEDYHREVMESYGVDPRPSGRSQPKQKRGKKKEGGKS